MSKKINIQKNLSSVKNELTLLKSIFVQKKKWYNNPTIIISIFALLLSIGSAVISYKQFQEQNLRNLKSELREILQRIITLNKENTEIMDNNPKRFRLYSSLLSEENVLMLDQALGIVKDLPKESICATEYFTLSKALFNAYRLEDALKYAWIMLEVSKDTHTKVTGYRWCAQQLFYMEKFERGRKEYEKAIKVILKETYPNHIKNLSNSETEYNWAISEANASFFENAQKHLEKAKKYTSLLPTSMQKVVYTDDLTETEFNISNDQFKKSTDELNRTFNELNKVLNEIK